MPQSPLRPGMQRHAIPFAVLEVGDIAMFTNAGLGHQRLTAIGIDLMQGSLDVGHGKVDQCPGIWDGAYPSDFMSIPVAPPPPGLMGNQAIFMGPISLKLSWKPNTVS